MMFCGAKVRLQRKAQTRSSMSSSAKDDELQPPVGERVEAVPQQCWEDNFVAGATASLLSKVVLQPLDFAKTLLQASPEVRGSYNNLGQCIAGVVKQGGVCKLYTGFLASVAVSGPSSAVFIACYECSKNAIEKVAATFPPPLASIQNIAPILAAAFGNLAASTVRVPPEVIKQRVQAGLYRDVLQAIKAIWVNEGFSGFYCGYSLQVSRDIPYSALQFMTFEMLKRQHSDAQMPGRRKKRVKGIADDLWMGALAGAVACTLTTPLDVAKTRVMTQDPTGNSVYLGLQATLQKIWLEEGVRGFGRGMVPRILYKVPASAVFLVCYGAMKRLLQATRSRQHHPTIKGPSPAAKSSRYTAPQLATHRSKAQVEEMKSKIHLD
ncbi:hypothetical protein CY35_03G141400 [Sphagnum magellanicum]|nr:hypothetical protein CY35_03G141400 [Sphagnum magellanicum]